MLSVYLFSCSEANGGRLKVWGCRLTDDSALERAKGRAVRPFLETADPWLTEARVVAAHGALHKAQVRLITSAYRLHRWGLG